MKQIRVRSFNFIAILLLILLTLSICEKKDISLDVFKTRAPETETTVSYPYELCEREELSRYERKLYDSYLPLLEQRESVEIDLYSIESAEQAYGVNYTLIAITKDYPEIENYLDPYQNYFEKDGIISCKCRWEPFSGEKQDIEAGVAKMQKVADSIIDAMPQDLSTYDKYLYLASELCKITQYDEELTEEGMRSYGALVDGSSSCSGYAAAYRYLCQRADLWCTTVVSDTHAWNLVKIEAGTYHVDVTWADEFEPYSRQWLTYVFMSQEEVLALEDHQIADGTVADGATFER